MKYDSINAVVIAVCITFFIACAALITEQDRTGFISDYSHLEKAGDSLYIYLGPKVASYSRFRIDEPEILSTPIPENPTNSQMKRSKI